MFTTGFSQEIPHIKTVGKTTIIDKDVYFEGKISLSTTYGDQSLSLKQIKENFNQEFHKKGLNFANLTENKTGYNAFYGYKSKGVILTFKTKNYNNFLKFLSSDVYGVQKLTYGAFVSLSDKETEIAFTKALKNARNKAEVIAKSTQQKVGKILSIDDNNLINSPMYNSVYYDRNPAEYIYQIIVTFELLNE